MNHLENTWLESPIHDKLDNNPFNIQNDMFFLSFMPQIEVPITHQEQQISQNYHQHLDLTPMAYEMDPYEKSSKNFAPTEVTAKEMPFSSNKNVSPVASSAFLSQKEQMAQIKMYQSQPNTNKTSSPIQIDVTNSFGDIHKLSDMNSFIHTLTTQLEDAIHHSTKGIYS